MPNLCFRCGHKLHSNHEQRVGHCWPCERALRNDPVISYAVKTFGGQPRYIPFDDAPQSDIASVKSQSL